MSDTPMADVRAVDALLLAAAVGAPMLLVLLWPARPWRAALVRLAPWAALPGLIAAWTVPAGAAIDVNWLVLGTRLGLDEAGPVFLLLTALLWGLSGAFAVAYLEPGPSRDRFFLFHLLAMTGNVGVVLSLDAPNYYAFFALMSFSSYGLVVHDGTGEARRAGRIYMYLVVAGELLLFAALVLIAVQTGATRLPVEATATMSQVALACAVFGFGIKAGLLPLHVWLPLAHPVAPTPASAVLSGAMIKAGVIGWLRFVPLGAVPQAEWGALLIVLGVVAAFYGVGVGLVQHNAKTVLAYSSISQMGFLTLGVGAALVAPEAWPALQAAVLVYALHHGLAKGALFLGVGVAGAAGARGRRWVVAGLALPALALAGAPLTSGAAAKTALKAATAALPGAWPDWLAVLLPLAAVGTTVLMVRLLTLLWRAASGEDHLTAALWVPWALLVGASAFACGLWPAAGEAWRTAAAPAEAFKGAWPVAAGALAGLGAWRWRWRTAATTPPVIPAGDVLAVVERAGRWGRRRLAAAGAAGPEGAMAGSRGRMAAWRAGVDRALDPDRLERALQQWPVTGVVLLALASTLLWVLAAG